MATDASIRNMDLSHSVTGTLAENRCRLELTARSADGEIAAEYSGDRDWAVVGRSAESDLVLDDPDVSFRHALFVPVSGRLFCLDLNSRTGIRGESGVSPGLWVAPGATVGIGPWEISARLSNAAELLPSAAPLGDPMASGSSEFGDLPEVEIEFVNVKAKSRRPMDRVITLFGSGTTCHLRFEPESVSRVHCCFVRTSRGVTVYDLLGKGGTQVNGRGIRECRLENGDLLQLGEFRLRVWVAPSGPRSPARGRDEFGDNGSQAPPDSQPDRELELPSELTALRAAVESERQLLEQARSGRSAKLISHDEDLAAETKQLEEQRDRIAADRKAHEQSVLLLDQHRKELDDREEAVRADETECEHLRASLETERGELQAERSRLAEQRDGLDSARNDLDAATRSVRDDRERVAIEVADQRRELEVVRQTLLSRSAALDSREGALRQHEARLRQRQHDAESTAADVDRRCEAIQQKQAELHGRENELGTLAAMLDRRERDLETACREAKSQRDAVNEDRTRVAAERESFLAEKASLDRDREDYLSGRSVEADQLVAERRALKQATEDLARERRRLDADLADEDQRSRELDRRRDELDARHAELERQTSELSESSQTCRQQRDEIDRDVAELQEEKARLERVRRQTEAGRAALEEDIAEQQRLREQLECDAKDCQSQQQRIEQERISLDEARRAWRQEQDRQRQELDTQSRAIECERDELQRERELAARSGSELEAAAAELRGEEARFREQLAELEAKQTQFHESRDKTEADLLAQRHDLQWEQQRRLNRLLAMRQELENAKVQIHHERDRLVRQRDELAVSLDRHRADEESCRLQLNDLEQQRGEIGRLTAKAEHRLREISSTEEELSGLRRQIEADRVELSQQRAACADETQANHRRQAELDRRNAELDEQADSLQCERRQLREERDRLEHEQQSLREQSAGWQQRQSRLVDAENRLAAQRLTLQNQVREVENERLQRTEGERAAARPAEKQPDSVRASQPEAKTPAVLETPGLFADADDRLSEFDRQISELRHGVLEDDHPALSRRALFWTALSLFAAVVLLAAAGVAVKWW